MANPNEPFTIPATPAVTVAPSAPVKGKAKSITVTFKGDPKGYTHANYKHNDPDPAEYGGKEFPKGEPVTVDDANWIKINGPTLRRNSHFTVE